MKEIKTAALIGAGAIGAFFADKIQPVLGDSFKIVAGGERGRRLRENGLVINGTRRFFNIVPSEDDSGADLVIIITKMTGLSQALEDIRGQIRPDTIIMVPLNGVDSEDEAAAVYGWERLVYSLMRVSSVRSGERVSFDDNLSLVEFGDRVNDPDTPSENVAAIMSLFDKTKIRYAVRPDMIRAIWEKFVCNVSENQVSAVLGLPFGAWRSCPDAEALRVMVAEEAIAVARKKGIMIDEDYARRHFENLKKIPAANMASTLQDIIAGRPTERDMLAGTVVRLGKELGVPTPYNEFLYRAIGVLEAKNAGTVEGL